MSKTQIKALLDAYETGNAVDEMKIYKNGAHMRMLNRMVDAGLLTATYAITEKGKQMLRELGHKVPEPLHMTDPSGPFRIRSSGVEDGKAWTRFHGEPMTNRELANQRLADLVARTARVYGKQPAPFIFELV